MASVYNNVTSNSLSSSVRGYGGLASGLDRDSLIEGMTAATRAKIAKQQKSKQTLQWKQDAYRSISSKLVEFSKKYTSYTNPATNLLSASFWAQNNVTAVGTNSKYVQVTGSSSNANSVSILGVEQLAKKASTISGGTVSDGVLETGEINLDEMKTVNTLEGQYLTFQVGNKTYSVSFKSGTDKNGKPYDYSNGSNTVDSINRALAEVSIGDDRTLADVLKASGEGDSADGSFTLDFTADDPAKNEVRLAGGSKGALEALGINSGDELVELGKEGATVIDDKGMSAKLKDNQTIFKNLSFESRIDGKSMSFTYNGVTKSITLAYKSDLKGMAEDIQKKLDKEFGTGRIHVEATTDNNGKLEFYTVKPGGDRDNFESLQKYLESYQDTSSDLAIAYADAGVTGADGALKVANGESNRLNLNVAIGKSGLISSNNVPVDLNIVINGHKIEGLTNKSTLKEIMDKINASDAGVTMSYMRNADKFSIVSKEEGASGEIKFDATFKDENGIDIPTDNAILFGDMAAQGPVYGQDAIVYVKYADSSDPVKLTRGSNTFDLDGLNVTVSGTFNTKGDDNSDEAVTFNAKTDSDKIAKAVSDMIKDYNDIIKMVNEQVSTKPNRQYEPLTDEQKAGMTEKQIEQWEAKAKEGLLFNDSDLRGLTDSMRFIFEGGSDKKALLESYGISTSTNYEDNGALVFDEVKFRAALEKSGDDLQKLFTQGEDTLTGDKGGLMTRLNGITQKYAATTGATKGILIEKAGSIYAPTSILSNSLKKSMDGIDSIIERLQSQLKTETDRYIKQFTSLETLISQMNSQSSWLQGAFGGQ
jgi:flagellar hook-associated protein 2